METCPIFKQVLPSVKMTLNMMGRTAKVPCEIVFQGMQRYSEG